MHLVGDRLGVGTRLRLALPQLLVGEAGLGVEGLDDDLAPVEVVDAVEVVEEDLLHLADDLGDGAPGRLGLGLDLLGVGGTRELALDQGDRVAVTPSYVAPPLLPVNFGMHGAAYGEANCVVDGVHLAPVLVVPVPALMPPVAGYAHG